MFDRLRDPALEEGYREKFAALLNYATLGFYWPMATGRSRIPPGRHVSQARSASLKVVVRVLS